MLDGRVKAPSFSERCSMVVNAFRVTMTGTLPSSTMMVFENLIRQYTNIAQQWPRASGEAYQKVTDSPFEIAPCVTEAM